MKRLISRLRHVTAFLILVVVLALVAWPTTHTTMSAAPGPSPAPVYVTNSGASQAIPFAPATARQRFQYRFPSCSMGVGDAGCNVTYNVPAGKLLVIETISAGESIAAGQRPFVMMQAYTDGLYNPFFLPPTYMYTDADSFDHYGATHTPRIYADPNTTITVFFQRDQTTGGGIGGATISGYLFDCASPSTCALP